MKPFLSEKDVLDIARKHGEPVDEPEYCGGSLLYALLELSRVYEKELSLIFAKVEKLEAEISKPVAADQPASVPADTPSPSGPLHTPYR